MGNSFLLIIESGLYFFVVVQLLLTAAFAQFYVVLFFLLVTEGLQLLKLSSFSLPGFFYLLVYLARYSIKVEYGDKKIKVQQAKHLLFQVVEPLEVGN